jgi:exopolysaccharide biosynthesis polyprenyl glycosylphosphotransferase
VESVGAVRDDRPTRSRGVTVEVLAGLTTGLAAAAATDVQILVLPALAVWALLSYPRLPALGGPLLRQVVPLAHGAAVVVALVTLLVVAGWASSAAQTEVVLTVTSAAVSSAVIRLVRGARIEPVRVLLVGDAMETTRLVERWRIRQDVTVVGAVLVDPDTDADHLPSDLHGVPTSTSLDELAARAQSTRADLVAFAPSPGLAPGAVRRAAWALRESHAALAVVGLFDSVAPHRVTASVIGGETLCEVAPSRRAAMLVAIKHALDRAGALVLLLAIAPVMGLVAIAVRLDSRGPAIFRQTRVGLDGKPFTVYKVRTMRVGADDVKHQLADVNEFDEVLFKMRRDPRVTRVGHFLRRASLDELPQLVNVLRGEMSLVGPRPLVPSEVADMGEDSLRRLSVKPGMTGLWQVSGRSDLDWERSIALDLHYVENWTLGGDAGIALRTVGAVLGAKGAY